MYKILEQVAFNISSLHDFSPEFVAANERFALAVIKEYQATQTEHKSRFPNPDDPGVLANVREKLLALGLKPVDDERMGMNAEQIKKEIEAFPGNKLTEMIREAQEALTAHNQTPALEKLQKSILNMLEIADEGIDTDNCFVHMVSSSAFEEVRESYETWQAEAALKPTVSQAPKQDYILTMPAMLHKSTKALIANFATALAQKAYEAEGKYGYGDHWAQPDWMDKCRSDLHHHVKKGDPRDVAIYCAFLWHHGESTAAA
jgi:hypothetical protein